MQSKGNMRSHQQHNYRGIGQVNRHQLQNSKCWAIKEMEGMEIQYLTTREMKETLFILSKCPYLGYIPDVGDWKSSESRTEFMHLIDQAQVKGKIMWSSLTPKLLHISPRWLVITDPGRKVTYGELLIAFIGSLSYAEKDSRHLLGIKTIVPSSSVLASLRSVKAASMQDGPEINGHFCCHVLECVSKVMVSQICSLLREHFQRFTMQLETKKQEKGNHVKSRRSKHPSTMSEAARLAPERHATERVPLETVSPECVSPIMQSNIPGRLIPNEVLYQVQSKGSPGPPRRLTLDHELHELAVATSSPTHYTIPFHEDSTMHEIGHQFPAVMKEPSQQHHGRGTKMDLKLKKIGTGSAGQMNRTPRGSIQDVFPILRVDKPKSHGHRVLNGIDLIEDNICLVPKTSGRVSIANKMSTESMENQRQTAKSVSRLGGGETGEERSQALLRTILLLETMEEGEKETRIDGDGKKTFLIQTTMGEKETAIVGSHGSAMLLPTSELVHYEAAKHQATLDAKKTFSSSKSQWEIESSSLALSPPPAPQLPEVKPVSKPETELKVKSVSKPETELKVKLASNELKVKSVSNELKVKSVSNELKVKSVSKELKVKSVSNELKVKSVSNELKVKSVSNELKVKSVSNELKVKSVSNELKVKPVSKELKVKSVSNELKVKSVSNELKVKSVSNELKVKSVSNELKVKSVFNELKVKSVSKPETEPQPEVPARQPWSDLIGIDDTVSDVGQKLFLEKLAQVLGSIEFRQFRQNWLEYQQCKLNVVQFSKKIKLLFRGSRAGLSEGAHVLLDHLDQQDFKDLLDGKEVGPKLVKTSSGPNKAPTHTSSVKHHSISSTATPPTVAKKPERFLFNNVASSPSPGGCPAKVRTGKLGNKLLMFEQLNDKADDNDLLSTNKPKPGYLSRLARSKENGDVYLSETEQPEPNGFHSNFERKDTTSETWNKRRQDRDRSNNKKYGHVDSYDNDHRGRGHNKSNSYDDQNKRNGERDGSGDLKGSSHRRENFDDHRRVRHNISNTYNDENQRHDERDGSGDGEGRHGKRDNFEDYRERRHNRGNDYDDYKGRHGERDGSCYHEARHGKRDNSEEHRGRRHNKSNDYKGRHGERDGSCYHEGKHGKKDNSEEHRGRRHNKSNDYDDYIGRHCERDSSGYHEGRHGKRYSSDNRKGKHGIRNNEDQSGRDCQHKKNDAKQKQRKEDEKKKRSPVCTHSMALQGLLDASGDLLSSDKTDNTFHALSKLMGSEEEVDYLHLTTQFLEDQNKEKPTTPAKETERPSKQASASTSIQAGAGAAGVWQPISQEIHQGVRSLNVQTTPYLQPGMQTQPTTQYVQQTAPIQYIQQEPSIQYIQHASEYVMPVEASVTECVMQAQTPAMNYVHQQTEQYLQKIIPTQYVQVEEATDHIDNEMVQYVEESQQSFAEQQVVQFIKETEQLLAQPQGVQYVQERHVRERQEPLAKLQAVQYVQETQQPLAKPQALQYPQETQKPLAQPQPVHYNPNLQPHQQFPSTQGNLQPHQQFPSTPGNQQPHQQFPSTQGNLQPHQQFPSTQGNQDVTETHNLQLKQNIYAPQQLVESVKQSTPQKMDSMLDEETVVTRFSDDDNENTPLQALLSLPVASKPLPSPSPPPAIDSHPRQRPSSYESPHSLLVNYEDDPYNQRDKFLEQIKGGKELKKTQGQKLEAYLPKHHDVFAEIRLGMKLRKVPVNEKRTRMRLMGRMVNNPCQEKRHDRPHRKGRTKDESQSERERGVRKQKEGRKGEHRDHEVLDEDKHQSKGTQKHNHQKEVDRYGTKEQRREEGGRGMKERREETERGEREEKGAGRWEEIQLKIKAKDQRGNKSDEDYHSKNKSHPPQPVLQDVLQKLPGLGAKKRSELKPVRNTVIPVWKTLLLERKHGIVKQAETPEATLSDERSQIQVGDKVPGWKQALLRKRQEQDIQMEVEAQGECEDPQLAHLPEWKKKLIKKKKMEQAAMEEEQRGKEQVYINKKAEIAAMPEWKRRLYLQKNQQ